MRLGKVGRLRMHLAAGLAACALLGACGGNSGVGSTPVPSPAPTPTPTPTPAPTPNPTTSPFDTAEFRRSDGPSEHNVIAAWQAGATGRGVTIGVIDSGIDPANTEFAGRIAAGSGDVAGNRGISQDDDHGTLVALVAAAARNNSGIVGIAYEASILAIRADAVGSCATADGCAFFDSAIAAGIDRATQNGAKVINISLGGSPPNNAVRSAIGRAGSAGVVVVVSAGNDADAPRPSQDPNNPDPFAAGLRAAGNGNVIIAGSVGATGALSAFANKAGSEADWYLSALGERICCVYEGSAPKITVQNGQNFVTVVSGTSFSAPQIAGAAALLRQAFPNLTANQVVNLLLTTGRDAGAAGVDSTYGRGILDIAAAFAPRGATSLAGTSSSLPLGDMTGTMSGAMGDAAQRAALSTVVLDSYCRAYRSDLGSRLSGAPAVPRLGAALLARMEQVSGGAGAVSLAFSVDGSGRLGASPWTGRLRLGSADARVAKVMAGRIAAEIAPQTRIAFGFSQGSDGLVAQVQGRSEPAFIVARDTADDFGFTRRAENSIALRQQFGRTGLTFSAAHGYADTRTNAFAPWRAASNFPHDDVSRLALALDRRFGALDAALGATWLTEDRTILGARLHDALGPRGAGSAFLDAQGVWRFAAGWRLGGAYRHGWTRAQTSGLIAAGSRFASSAWSLDLERQGIFAATDSLALRVAQPLRVRNGGLAFDLPVAWDYDTLSARRAVSTLSLSPTGRELDAELAWRGALWGGAASASLFWRRQPGHYRSAPADAGAALSWKTAF